MKKASKTSARNGRPAARGKSSRKESLEELRKRVAAKSPLMAKIFELSDSVPPEDWKKLPRDLSYNLDHYIYGLPKRRR